MFHVKAHFIFVQYLQHSEWNCTVDKPDIPKLCKNASTILLPAIMLLTLHLSQFRVYKWLKFIVNFHCIVFLFLFKPYLASQPNESWRKVHVRNSSNKNIGRLYTMLSIQQILWQFLSTLSNRKHIPHTMNYTQTNDHF